MLSIRINAVLRYRTNRISRANVSCQGCSSRQNKIKVLLTRFSRQDNPPYCKLKGLVCTDPMRTVKYEDVYMNDYQKLAEVRAPVQHFIDAVYSRKRLHSAIGYLPPAEFEAALSLPTLS